MNGTGKNYPATFPVILIVIACMTNLAAAAPELSFRRHHINPESKFLSAAVFDVNGDGKMDIVSGGFWYEAPAWNKHFLRQVQQVRGRHDDYSNLPLDVNGDGLTDLVSVNYRSKTIYWVEHPGKKLGQAAWTKHPIAEPGSSETGRLVDVDGDGKIDLLPNGTSYAAWFEIVRSKDAGAKWVRHELPNELRSHGIGFGDINGDGRGDLVNPRGWAEAPVDRRKGKWIWHPDFRLHRDCGIKILVLDVDDDGDNDLVWGRGHNIGVYWTEHIIENGKRSWKQHAIDTSWSQAHTVLAADLDNDGKVEVIAGKRYLGHDGRDPGEYDPLCVYWYKFDNKTRTWKRGQVSWGGAGGGAGMDLDAKAVDVDGDGDLDIVGASINGLYLYENLLIDKGPKPNGPGTTINAVASSASPTAPDYKDHSKLLEVADAAGKVRPFDTPFDWGLRRAHILGNMEKVMGRLPGPGRRVPLDVKVISEEDAGRYIRRKITYASEPGDRVPAYLLIPKKVSASAKTPAMLCLHPTSPLGKDQVAGLGGKPSRFYGHELANRGYICLIPDYPSFGEYKAYEFNKDGEQYVSGSMKAIWNNIRGLDLLEAMPEVRPDRIGCIGHSLGGHNALFTAAFDQRIRAVVTSCGFTAFGDYYGGNLKGWASDRYMPRIAAVYKSDPKAMPFDFHEVIGALAPRGLFVNAPLKDSNFDVGGVRKVISSAQQIYKYRNAQNKLKVVYPDVGHDFPQDIRQAVYKWLDQQLRR